MGKRQSQRSVPDPPGDPRPAQGQDADGSRDQTDIKPIPKIKGGIVCDTQDEMIETIKSGKIDEIKPEACRKNAEMFSREIMAHNYESLYKQIVNDNMEW